VPHGIHSIKISSNTFCTVALLRRDTAGERDKLASAHDRPENQNAAL
jgi:hypothetical protein